MYNELGEGVSVDEAACRSGRPSFATNTDDEFGSGTEGTDKSLAVKA